MVLANDPEKPGPGDGREHEAVAQGPGAWQRVLELAVVVHAGAAVAYATAAWVSMLR